MMSASTLLASFMIVLLVMKPVTSLDITKLLSQYSAFTSFTNYITQTDLATEINNRQTVTVLAVNNSGMAPINGKPMDVIKKFLSIHVILDYFDLEKLHQMNNQTLTVTTLFQSTGQAQGQQGFLKLNDVKTAPVTFVSASDPNGVGTTLIKAVVAQPFNISVMQVSNLILPPSLLTNTNNSPSAVSPSPVPVVPVPVPVPVISPVPIATPVPVPVVSPVPAIAPVPVESPVPVTVPVPVASPVPVLSPVPVVSPVPVISSVAAPAPASASPGATVPAPASASPGASDAPAADGGSDTNGESDPNAKSRVAQLRVNWALVVVLTLSSMYFGPELLAPYMLPAHIF